MINVISKRPYITAVFVSMLLLVIGCASPAVEPVDQAVVSDTVVPTISATTVPTATAKPATVPTITVVEISPTTQVELILPATVTPLPTAVSTLAPVILGETMVPFVEPDGYISPISFPVELNPFTGLFLPEQRRDQRPLAIKISNYPPEVRPQWGLNQADIIFEHMAERGVTRFTALFYGNEAERVGSIRSGRLIDLEIPKMYDAAFAYSGSAGLVREQFKESDFFDRIISPDFAHGGFERLPDGDKAFEHTLFTDTYLLHYLLDLREENVAPQLAKNMGFSNGVPQIDRDAASKVEVRYGGVNAFWAYQSGSGRYLRWTDGEPHLDAADNKQLVTDNVVVIYAHHQDTDILEDGNNGGNPSIQIQIWGRGRVRLFRDGMVFEGEWRREDPQHMLTFYDLQGNPLPLSLGKSFFQMVPADFAGVVVTP